MAAISIIVLVSILAGLWARARIKRGFEEGWRDTHSFNASGVVVGAEAISVRGGERAALLLHGFGDTPQTLSTIAESLRRRGWTVEVPLLPGHGRGLEEFARSRRVEWSSCVRAAYDGLVAGHDAVAVVGLSMGGALAVSLAAERKPRALVLLAPYLVLPPRGKLLTTFWRLWQLPRPYVEGNSNASIRDPAARAQSLGYGRATPRTLLELRRTVEAAQADSPTARAPTLAIFSVADYRIPGIEAERAFARLGADIKSLRWVDRSGHVITVDHDRETVTTETVEWLERYVPGGRP